MVNILYTDLVLLLNYQISKRFYYFKRSTCKDRRDAPLVSTFCYYISCCILWHAKFDISIAFLLYVTKRIIPFVFTSLCMISPWLTAPIGNKNDRVKIRINGTRGQISCPNYDNLHKNKSSLQPLNGCRLLFVCYFLHLTDTV
jgi:hypothetical protein